MPDRDRVPSKSEHGCRRCSARPSGSLLEAYLLLLIAENPAYGYQLHGRLDEKFFPVGCAPDEATVYRNLRKMEEQGLVESSWDMEGVGPPRRFYKIMPGGMEMLASWADGIRERRERLAMFIRRFEAFRKQSAKQAEKGDE